ncbi:helix-turn-helix protein [compost metagenome]
MKNWTQAQLAEQVQSTASYIGQIERGEVNFRFETLEKIAAALEIQLFSLFEQDELSELHQNKWIWDSLLLLLQQPPNKQRKAYRVLLELLVNDD